MKQLFFLLSWLPVVAFAQRAPISTPLEISSSAIFGGAIQSTISVSAPDPYTPTVLNGVAESGVADLRLKVKLNYLAAGQLGSRNIGEFVPYQTITVRIENLTTTDPENTVEFNLVPAVSAEEGWHYASEVRLPPVNSTEDLLTNEFRVSVVSLSLGSVALHFDAQPPSKLFRPESATDTSQLFDDLVDLSLARSLPHGSRTPSRSPTQDLPSVWGLLALLMSRRARAKLLGLCVVGACKVEPLFDEVPPFTQLILLQDRPVSGGAMLATISLERPDAINFPTAESAPFPGGNDNISGGTSDLYLQLDLRYAAAVQGGQKAGDFVPYIIVKAEIENLDTGKEVELFLTPHASIKNGYHYGRNVKLIDSVGLSEAGYLIDIQINPPALVTDDDFTSNVRGRSALSPGIVIGSDFAPFVLGTLFSLKTLTSRELDAINLKSTFTLADLAAGVSEDTGSVGYSY